MRASGPTEDGREWAPHGAANLSEVTAFVCAALRSAVGANDCDDPQNLAERARFFQEWGVFARTIYEAFQERTGTSRIEYRHTLQNCFPEYLDELEALVGPILQAGVVHIRCPDPLTRHLICQLILERAEAEDVLASRVTNLDHPAATVRFDANQILAYHWLHEDDDDDEGPAEQSDFLVDLGIDQPDDDTYPPTLSSLDRSTTEQLLRWREHAALSRRSYSVIEVGRDGRAVPGHEGDRPTSLDRHLRHASMFRAKRRENTFPHIFIVSTNGEVESVDGTYIPPPSIPTIGIEARPRVWLSRALPLADPALQLAVLLGDRGLDDDAIGAMEEAGDPVNHIRTLCEDVTRTIRCRLSEVRAFHGLCLHPRPVTAKIPSSTRPNFDFPSRSVLFDRVLRCLPPPESTTRYDRRARCFGRIPNRCVRHSRFSAGLPHAD